MSCAQDVAETSQQVLALLGQIPLSAVTQAGAALSTLQPPQLASIGTTVSQAETDKNAALCSAALSFGVDLAAKGFPCSSKAFG